MIQLVIFDLDGTLLNTIEDIAISLNKSLKYHNLPTHSLDTVLKMVGNGVDLLIQRAVNPYQDLFNDVKQYYLQDYNKNCDINTKPYKGIPELIKWLKDNNIKIAVLSNKPHIDTVTVMDKYFNNTFDYVCGKKDCNRIKPHRVLAINRGENEKVLSVSIDISFHVVSMKSCFKSGKILR